MQKYTQKWSSFISIGSGWPSHSFSVIIKDTPGRADVPVGVKGTNVTLH